MKGLRVPLLVSCIAVVLVLTFLVLTGRVVPFTEQVVLPTPIANPLGGGDVFYTTQFDGGVRNGSASEAKQGTAQVSLAEWTRDSNVPEIYFSLWHAEATRVKNLRLRLTGPSGWKPVFEFPGGDGWGPITYRVDAHGLLLEFDHLGSGGEGYAGTIGLSFPGLQPADSKAGERIKAEVEFDLCPIGFPRLKQWHVRGTWDVPVVMTAEEDQ